MKTQTKEIISLILFMLGIIGISALLIHIIGVWWFFGGIILLYGCWELYLEGKRIKQKKFYNEAYFRNLAIEDARKEASIYGCPYWRDEYNTDDVNFIVRRRNYACRAAFNRLSTKVIENVFGSGDFANKKWEKYQGIYTDAYKEFEKAWAYYYAKGQYDCKLTAASYPKAKIEREYKGFNLYRFMEGELKGKVEQIPEYYRHSYIHGYERELVFMYDDIERNSKKALYELKSENLDKYLIKYAQYKKDDDFYFIPNTRYYMKIKTNKWFEKPGVFDEVFDNPTW